MLGIELAIKHLHGSYTLILMERVLFAGDFGVRPED